MTPEQRFRRNQDRVVRSFRLEALSSFNDSHRGMEGAPRRALKEEFNKNLDRWEKWFRSQPSSLEP